MFWWLQACWRKPGFRVPPYISNLPYYQFTGLITFQFTETNIEAE